MELEQKIQKINLKLRQSLKGKENIVVRGSGIHTEKLLCLTCIIDFWDKISIVDKRPYGVIGNKTVKGIDEIQWNLVDAVVISSLTYQKDMENELLANESFNGEIIQLYDEGEVSQFFELQKEYNFLTLEKAPSWKVAAQKSKAGYADEDILLFDYKEFIEHRDRREKNLIRHHYDVLFYMLKTVVQLQKKEISVLDFGGGFGTVFVDLQYYLKNLDISFKWTIVEQEKIVEQCTQEPNDIGIIFENSLENVSGKEPFDLALFGSCLQYIENYDEIIRKVITFHPHRIAILKTPVSDETFVTVQHVNRMGNYNHYIGDYACRVIKEEDLISLFSDHYRLEDTAEDVFNAPDNHLDNHIVKWKDFFFELSK